MAAIDRPRTDHAVIFVFMIVTDKFCRHSTDRMGCSFRSRTPERLVALAAGIGPAGTEILQRAVAEAEQFPALAGAFLPAEQGIDQHGDALRHRGLHAAVLSSPVANGNIPWPQPPDGQL